MLEHPSINQIQKIRVRHFGQLFIRFFLLIFACFLVVLIILQVFWYFNTRSLLDRELDEANSRALSKVQTVVDSVREGALSTTLFFSVNEDVHTFMSLPAASASSYKYHTVDMYTRLLSQMSSWLESSAFESILFYSRIGNSILSSDYGASLLNLYPDKAVIELADTLNLRDGQLVYLIRERSPLHFPITGHEIAQCLSLIMKTGLPYDGYIIINGSLETLGTLMVNARTDPVSDILMLDSDGLILLDSAQKSTGLSLSELCSDSVFADSVLSSGHGAVNVFINDRMMRASWLHSALDQITYLQLVPYDHYAGLIKNLIYTTILTLTLGSIFSLVLSLVLARYVHRPIQLITRVADNPSSHPEEVYDAETRYILMKLITANDETAKLEEENLRQFEILKQAQASVLQAQITPHFLYNALQSIHIMILMETGNNDSAAAKAVLALSAIARNILEKGVDTVKLCDELDCLNQYIYLKKLSYEDQLEVIIDIPDRLRFYTVPKLCLQPLLENTIRHSMRSGSKCTARIRVREEGDLLTISMDDNGIGMTPEQMASLNHIVRQDVVFPSAHVGLVNLSQRLRLLYGDLAELRLSSSELGGLCVTFRLPKLMG
ncbi:MAG: histidine kinase [Clostridiales bacterium]|nr:histidine kinase [Clostridiales bacterium]